METRIRMKTLAAGPGVLRTPGEVYVVSAEEGEMLVGGGYATLMPKIPSQAEIVQAPAAEQAASAESAPAAAAESADARKGRKK